MRMSAAAATKLEDTLERESFFRELPAIDQARPCGREAYKSRYREAVTHRAESIRGSRHLAVHARMGGTQRGTAEENRGATLETCPTAFPQPIPIPELRADIDACPARLGRADGGLCSQEGDRLVKMSVAAYFAGGIESEEQLDSAIQAFATTACTILERARKC